MWDWAQCKGESRQIARQIGGIQDTHDLIEKIEKPNKSFERDVVCAAASPTPLKLSVSAPSEAWCILQGESPCRVRVSHSPVSSVAPVAEFYIVERTKQVKRTQRIL